MLPEYDHIRTLIKVTVNDPTDKQRILEQLEKAEIKTIYEDQKALLGYGYGTDIKQMLARHFNKSYKTIEKIVYK